jgi:hypothetical protein
VLTRKTSNKPSDMLVVEIPDVRAPREVLVASSKRLVPGAPASSKATRYAPVDTGYGLLLWDLDLGAHKKSPTA